MENETVSKFKLFGAWNDDKEEAWLSRMAGEGLHLQSLGLPGMYIFVRGEPRPDVYRMDFIVDRKDYQNYLQLFRDAGWEHIGEMGGWQYFRTRQQGGQVPEIYTDNASKTQKYARLIALLTIFMPIFIVMVTRPVTGEGGVFEFYNIMKMVLSAFLLLYVYAMVRILMRISQLRKK